MLCALRPSAPATPAVVLVASTTAAPLRRLALLPCVLLRLPYGVDQGIRHTTVLNLG